MANVKLVLDKRRMTENGEYPIKLYFTHRSSFFISTGYKCFPGSWVDGRISSKEKAGKQKNSVILGLFIKAEELLVSLRQSARLEVMTDKELKMEMERELFGKSDKPLSILVDYIDKHIETLIKQSTKSTFVYTRRKVAEFDAGVNLASVDSKWLQRFDKWMSDDGMSTNGRSVYLRCLRRIFNCAIDDELTANYPFRKFKIKSERTAKRSLSVDELRRLRDYPVAEWQEKYRDLFLLSFYLLGINMIDLLHLKEIRNGRIEYRRSKTGRLYSVLVQPEAMAIIERYRGENYLLNIMDAYSNYKDFVHRMNDALGKIGEVTMVKNAAQNPKDTKKNKKEVTAAFPGLTTYWARHTWATIAAGLDVPKETIAAALGHGGNSVTDIYIDFDQKKVDEANRKVIDFLMV